MSEAERLAQEEGLAGFKKRLLDREVEEPPRDGAGGDEDDCRTLEVFRDGQGQRWREWREVCTSLSEPDFADWPVEDSRSACWLARHMLRHGNTPTGFTEIYLREKGIAPKDRAVFELRHLAEVLEYGGCYDQLNVSGLASFELIARRYQAIIAAHKTDAGRPNYDESKFYRGLGSPLDAISPVLTASVTRRMRDEAEIEKQRHKAAEVRKPGGGGK